MLLGMLFSFENLVQLNINKENSLDLVIEEHLIQKIKHFCSIEI